MKNIIFKMDKCKYKTDKKKKNLYIFNYFLSLKVNANTKNVSVQEKMYH